MTDVEVGNEIYLFSHIPKTGGSTVLEHFGEFLGKHFALVDGSTTSVKRLTSTELHTQSEEQRSSLIFVVGHGVKAATAELFPNREARFVTTLRDPADIMLSQYNYRLGKALNGENGYRHPITYGPKGNLVLPDFESFWRSYGKRDMLTNHILSLFGGETANGLKGDEAVGCAIAVLESFWLVADCYSLAEDFQPVTSALKIPPINSVANKSMRLHVMSDAIKDFCSEYWALDRKLYDHYRKIVRPDKHKTGSLQA